MDFMETVKAYMAAIGKEVELLPYTASHELQLFATEVSLKTDMTKSAILSAVSKVEQFTKNALDHIKAVIESAAGIPAPVSSTTTTGSVVQPPPVAPVASVVVPPVTQGTVVTPVAPVAPVVPPVTQGTVVPPVIVNTSNQSLSESNDSGNVNTESSNEG